MTVNGDFTTLNTSLREVELLHVDATSSSTAGIITQRGSGDILNLFDNNSEVLTVTDGGQIGINSITPSNSALIDIGAPTIKTGSRDATVSIASTENKTYPTASSFSVTLGLKQEIEVGGTQTIDATTPGGFNFITGITNWMRKKNSNVQDVERSYYAGINQNFSWNDANTLKQYVGFTDSLTYFGNDANGRTTSYLGAKSIVVNPGAGKTQTINIAQGEGISFRNFDAGTTKTVNITDWKGHNPSFSFLTIGGAIQGTTTNAAFYDTGSSWGFNGSGSISYTVTNLYGLRLRPPTSSTGLTVTNNYGIHQGWSAAKNYFAGNVGIGTDTLFTGGAHSGTHQLTITNNAPSMSLGVSNTDQLYVRREQANGKYTFQTNQSGGNNGVISLEPYGGNVGIGSLLPSEKLDVIGNIKASGTIIAKQSGIQTSQTGVALVVNHSTTPAMRGNHFIVDDFPSGGGTYFIQATEANVSNDRNLCLQGYGGKVKIGGQGTAPTEVLDVNGNVKANNFIGGLPITDGADNRVITATGANAITGESKLTFDASTTQLKITRDDDSNSGLYLFHNDGNECARLVQKGTGHEGTLVLLSLIHI